MNGDKYARAMSDNVTYVRFNNRFTARTQYYERHVRFNGSRAKCRYLDSLALRRALSFFFSLRGERASEIIIRHRRRRVY